MKTLLRRVNEIEQKVANGDVKTEVRQLLSTLEEMKKALGEGMTTALKNSRNDSSYKTETMSNKTPFWNEHNQVYQLDFGGRVTQESAKNFQVTYLEIASLLSMIAFLDRVRQQTSSAIRQNRRRLVHARLPVPVFRITGVRCRPSQHNTTIEVRGEKREHKRKTPLENIPSSIMIPITFHFST